jgi:hypothetical protein
MLWSMICTKKFYLLIFEMVQNFSHDNYTKYKYKHCSRCFGIMGGHDLFF